MKPLLARYLVAVLFFASTAFLSAGDFQSAILMANQQLQIHVPDDRFLVIRNFTQQGGMNRGVVTVSKDGFIAEVLAAAFVDPMATSPEVINNIIIAGLSDVTVTCGSDATTCFISYRKGSD